MVNFVLEKETADDHDMGKGRERDYLEMHSLSQFRFFSTLMRDVVWSACDGNMATLNSALNKVLIQYKIKESKEFDWTFDGAHREAHSGLDAIKETTEAEVSIHLFNDHYIH